MEIEWIFINTNEWNAKFVEKPNGFVEIVIIFLALSQWGECTVSCYILICLARDVCLVM